MSPAIPQVISGRAFLHDDLTFQPVDITIEEGIIVAIDEAENVPDLWICPALFNAHTHLGDTIAMDIPTSGDLVSLVTPPEGLKHQFLKNATRAERIAGMRGSVRFMVGRGTAGCADFREGGTEGVDELRTAVAGQAFRSIIFGRDGGEAVADGLGVSSTRDIPDIEEMVAKEKQNGGMVAFHAGEKDSLDVDTALAFDPDLIIHATHATDKHLKFCADNDIPITVCPRSNWILSVTGSAKNPPIKKMLRFGCRIFLGTDNAMFVQPDLLSEMAFLSTVYHIDPVTILRMAVEGSSLTRETFFITKGARANFFIIDPRASNLSFCKNPVSGMVNRAFSTATCKNVFNL